MNIHKFIPANTLHRVQDKAHDRTASIRSSGKFLHASNAIWVQNDFLAPQRVQSKPEANPRAKRAVLRHCFAKCKAVRIRPKTGPIVTHKPSASHAYDPPVCPAFLQQVRHQPPLLARPILPLRVVWARSLPGPHAWRRRKLRGCVREWQGWQREWMGMGSTGGSLGRLPRRYV